MRKVTPQLAELREREDRSRAEWRAVFWPLKNAPEIGTGRLFGGWRTTETQREIKYAGVKYLDIEILDIESFDIELLPAEKLSFQYLDVEEFDMHV